MSSLNRWTRDLARWYVGVVLTLALPVTGLAQTDDLPKPVVDLKPGRFNYKTRMEINGRVVPMDLTHTVKSQGSTWVITDSLKFAGYTAVDSGIIEKKTLISRSRTFHDPTTSVDMRFAGRNATGTITTKGQTQPISINIGGVLFADGPGGQDVISALPLANGYSTEFLNFKYETQQIAQQQLRVLGADSVTVPAGTFDTWKVLIISADGGPGDTAAMWIDKKSRRVVKIASTLLGRNEMIVTAELTK
jgi:hypothetical protein